MEALSAARRARRRPRPGRSRPRPGRPWPQPRPRAGSRIGRSLLALLTTALCGCTYQVRPPIDPRDPVSVFIADYGFHSTLLLPRADGSVVEYAYGEREWFARNHEEWFRVAPVLLWPTPAVLGRRELAAPPRYDALREHIRPEALHEVPVERSAAARLARKLDADFDSRRAEAIENRRLGMTFVPYDPPYSLLSHCNMFVAQWLREMGCEVTGLAAIADYRVIHRR